MIFEWQAFQKFIFIRVLKYTSSKWAHLMEIYVYLLDISIDPTHLSSCIRDLQKGREFAFVQIYSSLTDIKCSFKSNVIHAGQSSLKVDLA